MQQCPILSLGRDSSLLVFLSSSIQCVAGIRSDNKSNGRMEI